MKVISAETHPQPAADEVPPDAGCRSPFGSPAPQAWRKGRRDLRIDFLRGVAMGIVVVNHLPVPSHFHALTIERIGVVTGAELFVVLSGLVLGLVHGPRVREGQGVEVARRLFGRAARLYGCVVAVGLAAAAWACVPGGYGEVLTTWTDESGTVYPLYAAAPWTSRSALLDLLLMRQSPWQFNIVGLYVALLAGAPIALLACRSGRTGLLLVGSLCVYALAANVEFRLTSAAFERSFPLLVWQFPFVCALTCGFWHDRLVAFAETRIGRSARVGAFLLAFGLILCAWSNPWTTGHHAHVPGPLRLGVVPERWFNWLYVHIFQVRTWLGPGRLLNTAVVVAVALELLRLAWRPASRLLGWWMLPVGRNSLRVFVLQLLFLPAVAAWDALVGGAMATYTAVHLVVLLALWSAVHRRPAGGPVPLRRGSPGRRGHGA